MTEEAQAQAPSGVDALSKGDQKALRQLLASVRRREKASMGEFYAVVHAGKLLFVHEHDPNSGQKPHEAARHHLVSAHPELVDEDGVSVKPEMHKLDLEELAPEG